MPTTTLHTFVVRLPDDLAKHVQRLADEREKNVASVLRQAVREHIERHSERKVDAV